MSNSLLSWVTVFFCDMFIKRHPINEFISGGFVVVEAGCIAVISDSPCRRDCWPHRDSIRHAGYS